MSNVSHWSGSASCILIKSLKKWVVGIKQVWTDLLVIWYGPHAFPVREAAIHHTHPLKWLILRYFTCRVSVLSLVHHSYLKAPCEWNHACPFLSVWAAEKLWGGSETFAVFRGQQNWCQVKLLVHQLNLQGWKWKCGVSKMSYFIRVWDGKVEDTHCNKLDSQDNGENLIRRRKVRTAYWNILRGKGILWCEARIKVQRSWWVIWSCCMLLVWRSSTNIGN